MNAAANNSSTTTLTLSNGVGQRCCARCGRDLSDPASVNRGVGPVCRDLDNRVLAQQMPAQVTAARQIWRAARGLFTLGDAMAMGHVDVVHEALCRRIMGRDSDWREVIKSLEALRSWAIIGERGRDAIDGVAGALGYTALVALWSHEVVKGAAKVFFDEASGRLVVTGPRPPKACQRKLCGVTGVRRFKGHGRWEFSAFTAEAAAEVINRSYMRLDGDLKACVAAANAHVTAERARRAEARRIADGDDAVVTIDIVPGGWISVKTPFNAAFVADLKAQVTPWQDRRWDRRNRVWIVRNEHRATVAKLTLDHFA